MTFPLLLHVMLAGSLLVAAAPAQGRVVVLGVDGMDHAVTSELIAQGRLPNLKALGERGTFRPLHPTNPAQSPVSWASGTLTSWRSDPTKPSSSKKYHTGFPHLRA